MHVHEGQVCGSGSSMNAFANAGGHFNPRRQPHPMHAGDLPALLTSQRGEAFARTYTDRFLPRDVVGRTVIIHANADDYHSQPAGNSGARIGCGEIERQ